MDESSLQPALTLEKLLPNATLASTVDEDLLSEIILYHPDLNAVNLRCELVLLPKHKITSTIPTIINLFNGVDLRRDARSQVCEHSSCNTVGFAIDNSFMRAFFRWFASDQNLLEKYHLNQQRLNSMINAAARTEQLDSINLVSVAQDVASLNDTRRTMYGAFTGL